MYFNSNKKKEKKSLKLLLLYVVVIIEVLHILWPLGDLDGVYFNVFILLIFCFFVAIPDTLSSSLILPPTPATCHLILCSMCWIDFFFAYSDRFIVRKIKKSQIFIFDSEKGKKILFSRLKNMLIRFAVSVIKLMSDILHCFQCRTRERCVYIIFRILQIEPFCCTLPKKKKKKFNLYFEWKLPEHKLL